MQVRGRSRVVRPRADGRTRAVPHPNGSCTHNAGGVGRLRCRRTASCRPRQTQPATSGPRRDPGPPREPTTCRPHRRGAQPGHRRRPRPGLRDPPLRRRRPRRAARRDRRAPTRSWSARPPRSTPRRWPPRTRLRVIARAGVGLDNVDVRAATQNGVMVVNAPTSNIVSAAELAVGPDARRGAPHQPRARRADPGRSGSAAATPASSCTRRPSASSGSAASACSSRSGWPPSAWT